MKPTRTFRITGQEHEVPGIETLLRTEGFDFEPALLHPRVRVLQEEPFALGRSLAARLGLIYIQDISSMVPPLVLAPHPGDVVLDLCASPGSKTGMLAEAVGLRGMVMANEPSPRRLATLRANMRQIGAVEVVTTSFARFPKLPSTLGFPRILVDAPCSGWGTAHKHPEVLRLWREEKTQTLESLQRALLARAAENGMAILGANHTGDAPFPLAGFSAAVSANAELEALGEAPDILVAQVSPATAHLDPTPCRRKDLYGAPPSLCHVLEL
jgi:16S rRNA (cytosine1407-C5)-methyltransferase